MSAAGVRSGVEGQSNRCVSDSFRRHQGHADRSLDLPGISALWSPQAAVAMVLVGQERSARRNLRSRSLSARQSLGVYEANTGGQPGRLKRKCVPRVMEIPRLDVLSVVLGDVSCDGIPD